MPFIIPGQTPIPRVDNLGRVRDRVACPQAPSTRPAELGWMVHEGIGELARSRLRGSSYLALRGLGCAYDKGVLTLWGWLPTHDLKPVARTMAGDVAGVTTLINTIAVVPPRRRPTVVHDRELQE